MHRGFDLAGKVAVLTGSTSGMGFAIARGLAECGAKVVLSSHEQDDTDEATRKLVELGYDAKGVKCDVTDPADVERFGANAISAYLIVRLPESVSFLALKQRTTSIPRILGRIFPGTTFPSEAQFWLPRETDIENRKSALLSPRYAITAAMLTGLPCARPSIINGSQLSIPPRKCCSKSRGVPLSDPKRRYTALSHAFKRNLRHLFSGLTVAGRVEDTPLLDAVAFLQACLRGGTPLRQRNPSSFPTAFIPKALKPHLYRPGPGKAKQLDVDRYEFLIYRLVRNALEAGDFFCHDSNEFRRLEDDLISDARWQHKDGPRAPGFAGDSGTTR
nr:SDR family NAD(P)-dependent oxidoreductase [Paraburkholderia terrae]